MTNQETIALHTIYHNIKNGFSYGYFYEPTNPALKGEDLFSYVLYYTIHKNIGWSHFGSSAMKCNISNLKWILKHIFNMTATEFINKYVTTI